MFASTTSQRGGIGFTAWLALGLLAAHSSVASDFDRLDAERIARIVESADARRHESLSMRDLLAMPPALKDTRSTLLLVKTGQGNLARLLVDGGYRKSSDSQTTVPVLVIERFETFEPGKGSSRIARGAGTLLFDGFQFDLDTGNVVPKEQGGDLVFQGQGGAAQSPDEGRLATLKGASLFSVAKPLVFEAARGGPSPGRVVLPADFHGKYRLFADGRWSGTIELLVDEARVVTGTFRSEPNGTSYSLRGQVATEPPSKVTFTIKFPRTEQEYEVYLWSEGKSAWAGTFTMQGKTYGVFAVREGASLEVPR
ncbi:MAG: biopolymer transporter ExbD [Isosphaeraceae bacterium]